MDTNYPLLNHRWHPTRMHLSGRLREPFFAQSHPHSFKIRYFYCPREIGTLRTIKRREIGKKTLMLGKSFFSQLSNPLQFFAHSLH